MIMFRRLLAVSLLVGLCALPKQEVAAAQNADAVVRAVLFYSPSCGHCHYVITEVLPPLQEKYGDQLQILGVDASQPDGNALFIATLSKFGMDSGGVPLLVIGETYLIGSMDIPERLPGLIEQHLAQGGLDWPNIPGLAEMVAASMPAEATESAPGTVTDPAIAIEVDNSLEARFTRDLAGNTLSVIVLIGMVVSAIAGTFVLTTPNTPLKDLWEKAIPVLCVIGLVVAGYLGYIEVTRTEAVCGPVGDCNTVNQSEYARLFGVLPIGVMGIAGYIAILAAWVVSRYGQGMLAALAAIAMLGMTAFGLLFSIYLTFLEPFVIGATCAWCLTSAVLMTALFWLSLAPGRSAWTTLVQSGILWRMLGSKKPRHPESTYQTEPKSE
ncbi:MAG: vitamin K epoxide reductase [Anaerolineae bacterium]|nr:vitamin K epoxide reductase [Anaerolineae bacterium]